MDTWYNDTSFTGIGRTILGVFRQELGIDWDITFVSDKEIGFVEEDNSTRGLFKMLKNNVCFPLPIPNAFFLYANSLRKRTSLWPTPVKFMDDKNTSIFLDPLAKSSGTS